METLVGPEESRETQRRQDVGRGRLPDFLIIGGMKCGTTSLHRYLEMHPGVFMSKKKELKFFVDAKVGNWSRGLDWYRAQFAEAQDGQIAGEATPEYTKRTVFPGAAEKIAEILPDVRLIYILRDPIDRMLSHWVHMRASGREKRGVAEALLATDRNPYFDCSAYAMQLEPYLELFPRERIHITTMDDLERDPARTMREIFAFLGIDAEFFSDEFRKVFHASSKKRRRTGLDLALSRVIPRPVMKRLRTVPFLENRLLVPISKPTLTDAEHAELRTRFRGEIQKLRELTGRTFEDWRTAE